MSKEEPLSFEWFKGSDLAIQSWCLDYHDLSDAGFLERGYKRYVEYHTEMVEAEKNK